EFRRVLFRSLVEPGPADAAGPEANRAGQPVVRAPKDDRFAHRIARDDLAGGQKDDGPPPAERAGRELGEAEVLLFLSPDRIEALRGGDAAQFLRQEDVLVCLCILPDTVTVISAVRVRVEAADGGQVGPGDGGGRDRPGEVAPRNGPTVPQIWGQAANVTRRVRRWKPPHPAWHVEICD